MRGFLLFTGALTLFLSTIGFGQELQNVRVKFENGLIAVHYDIISSDIDQLFEFYLYGSHDNYSSPLLEVSGDVGQKLKPGIDKTIFWDARKEFGNFKGDVNLKIKGGYYTPLITIDDFTSDQKIKKSKPINITWKPGIKLAELNMELLRNGQPVGKASAFSNTGNYTWVVPPETKPGSGYQIRFFSPDNPLKDEISEEFTIKRKTSNIVKIAPVALLGGAAYFLIGNSKGSGSEQIDDIPDPPSP